LQTSRRNAKKELQQEERFQGIERENMRLLLRMHEIERRSAAKSAAQVVLGGGGDAVKAAASAAARSGSCPAGSRTNVRMKELRRIDSENQRMLKRLQGAKSSVSMKDLNERNRQQEGYMRLRCNEQRPEWQREDAARRRAANQARLARAASEAPRDPVDEEMEALSRLQDHFRRQAEDDGADFEREQEELAGEPLSFRGSHAGSPQAILSPPRQREGIGGQIPASSQAIVDQLMADHLREAEAQDQLLGGMGGNHEEESAEEESAEEAHRAAKEAAAKAFSLATACGAGQEDMLDFHHVIQRSNLGPGRPR